MKYTDLKISFKQYALRERGMTPKACKCILASMERLIANTENDNIPKMTENVIREFLNSESEQWNWSPKTYRNQRQSLRSFFEWCVKKGYIKKNPTDKIEKPKLPKTLPRFLTRDEVKTILASVEWVDWRTQFEAIRNKTIISTFLFTGIRHQELLNLKVNDVDLNNGTIFIQKGKGSKDRIVPIHSRLLSVFHSYVNTKKELGRNSEWFFHSAKSKEKLGQKNVQTICERVSKKCEIKFTPHMLRHTFGRLSVEGNLNIYTVREIMGHSDITTTQRYLSISTGKLKSEFQGIKFL